MQIDSSDLLRVLGSGVRQSVSHAIAKNPMLGTFAALLEQAQGSGLDTGLPVSVDHSVDATLSAQTLKQLSSVVDRAHAAGATRIVVLIGDEAFDVDVLGRRVLGKINLDDGRVMTEIDGIVKLASDGSGFNFKPLLPGEQRLPGASLLAALEKTQR